MLLYDMLALQVPYYDLDRQQDICQCGRNAIIPCLPENLSKEYEPFIKLMRWCLKREPESRPTASHIVSQLQACKDDISRSTHVDSSVFNDPTVDLNVDVDVDVVGEVGAGI